MSVIELNALMYLTRDELADLAQQIERDLCGLDLGTIARSRALQSLSNIRRVMVLRNLHF